MTESFLTGLACGALLAWALDAALRWTRQHLAKINQELEQVLGKTPAPAHDKPATQSPSTPALRTGWFLLPGNVLEYRDTGWQIHYDERRQPRPFELRTPQGDVYAWAARLESLQEDAEEMVRERAAFRHGPQSGAALPDYLLMVAATCVLAWILGVFGPALDEQPDRRAEFSQAHDLELAGAVASWEAEARRLCAQQGSENSAYRRTADGGIVCTDKRGRQLVAQGSR